MKQRPLKSPLRYPGGKSRVAKYLREYAPAKYNDYREIFAGGAAMFFQLPRARKSWINDLHPGLYALYKTLRDDFDAFAKECRKLDGDRRKIFNDLIGRRKLMEATGDDHLLERAVQYYYLNRTVWGGRVVFDPERKSRLYFSNPEGWNNIEKKLEHMRLISEKLAGVNITCLDFKHCLKGATEETFIYADPPYIRESDCHPTDKLYDKSFTFDCHSRLAKALDATPAKVMISYDVCQEVRERYSDPKWHFEELQWKYCGRRAVSKEHKSANRKEKKIEGGELLVFNYPPPLERKPVRIMRYNEELKKRVKKAHAEMMELHRGIPGRGDRWVTDPQLRSEFIQHVTECEWSESEILGCLLSMRKASKL